MPVRIQPVKGVAYRREAPAAVVAAEAGKPIVCKISDESVDRYESTIALDGWNLANYQKNPVVLWAHDSYSPPIARAENTRIEKDGLYSEPVFAPTEFAQMVEQLVRGSFLNGVSVSWQSEEWTYDEKADVMRFLKQELLEWSFVPIPGNAGALVEARAAGIDTRPAREWAERLLALGVGSKRDLEAVALAAQAPRLFTFGRGVGGKRIELGAPTAEGLEALVLKLDKRDDGEGEPAMVPCPECKTEMAPDAKFCSACGSKMEAAPVEDPPAEEPAAAAAPSGEARAVTADELVAMATTATTKALGT